MCVVASTRVLPHGGDVKIVTGTRVTPVSTPPPTLYLRRDLRLAPLAKKHDKHDSEVERRKTRFLLFKLSHTLSKQVTIVSDGASFFASPSVQNDT